ncbi:hypothetical protein Q5H92_08975 [Hymenobacter sp. M29]|uniref:Uncharacterized protein n=1 Tax=Hymenobacter mellowenesis TaxID=3063995 RepID=A0ABT9A9H7_9BACT|nr:hypothetical protein [Hymenobacter sp. M29]MDO7846488.1 hypothetical protein [Hymenobacter sp. M29]
MLLQLANKLEAAGQTARLAKLGAYSEAELRTYLDLVPCIFAYRRADNEANRRSGRVGRNSGFRQGVRNPAFIPAEKQAKTKSNSTRYYDLGRQDWRSWRAGNVVSVTAFWSVFGNEYVDTPEAAGLQGQKPFGIVPMTEPKLDPARAARTAGRTATKTRREQTSTKRALRR